MKDTHRLTALAPALCSFSGALHLERCVMNDSRGLEAEEGRDNDARPTRLSPSNSNSSIRPHPLIMAKSSKRRAVRSKLTWSLAEDVSSDTYDAGI